MAEAFSLQPSAAAERLIVALDFTTLAEAAAMARRLQGVIRTVKVGSILFTAAGPAAIDRMRRLGFDVMLDIKFLDIPSTVELSCRAAVHHRVSLLTIHACGEPAMLKAGVRGVREEARRHRLPRPRLLGVTVLTSMGGRAASVRRRVMTLAAAAASAGCDGIVTSAQEAAAVRARFGPRLGIACPGIRPADVSNGDQQRVMTPRNALEAGADWLIVGRPITAARDPRKATRQMLRAMEEKGC